MDATSVAASPSSASSMRLGFGVRSTANSVFAFALAILVRRSRAPSHRGPSRRARQVARQRVERRVVEEQRRRTAAVRWPRSARCAAPPPSANRARAPSAACAGRRLVAGSSPRTCKRSLGEVAASALGAAGPRAMACHVRGDAQCLGSPRPRCAFDRTRRDSCEEGAINALRQSGAGSGPNRSGSTPHMAAPSRIKRSRRAKPSAGFDLSQAARPPNASLPGSRADAAMPAPAHAPQATLSAGSPQTATHARKRIELGVGRGVGALPACPSSTPAAEYMDEEVERHVARQLVQHPCAMRLAAHHRLRVRPVWCMQDAVVAATRGMDTPRSGGMLANDVVKHAIACARVGGIRLDHANVCAAALPALPGPASRHRRARDDRSARDGSPRDRQASAPSRGQARRVLR